VSGRASQDRIAGPFLEFRRNNPHVERRLIELLEEYRAGGAKHVSIKHLWEIMRREAWLQTSGELWKLNNNFPSRYARVIRESRPDLAAMFSLRRLATEPTAAELEARRLQTDAFPDTPRDVDRVIVTTTPTTRVSPALQRVASDSATRVATASKGSPGRESRNTVVGQRVRCAFAACGVEFTVRRRGQTFHHSTCRTRQWMLDHPRT
jgi:hypothetical protein